MTVSLQPGNVIKYDYLWRVEVEKGKAIGMKDRPCSVVLLIDMQDDDGTKYQKVYIAAITHTPPSDAIQTTGIEIPRKVADYLGLDDRPQWIVTSELNSFDLHAGKLPLGIVPIASNQYIYGSLPDELYVQLFNEIRNKLKEIGAVPHRD